MAHVGLSVVLATTHDSDDLRNAIACHTAGLARVGGELLIADGTQNGLPTDVAVAVHLPGADVFTLRAAASKLAREAIVAVTEDHCKPEPGWHEAIVRAHEEHPNVAAVSGAVLNGSPNSIADWANFLSIFGPFLPPLSASAVERVPPPFNVSIKREILDGFELTPGRIEMEIFPHMFHVDQMAVDDRIRLSHIQSHDLRSTTAAHFHNGRSTAGLPYRRPPTRELATRSAHNLILPFLLMAQYTRALRRKPGYGRIALRASPLVFLFVCAHAAGEFVGTLRGPGSSPARLEYDE
ncbi:MAG: glycosyltransferase family 2 protein [Thermoleophilaceae bacterium]|nr:glycosyltransferase family 2 protein [Thermoleophilaceae bacterium]